LYFRLFPNMGDKTYPFTVGLYYRPTIMQKVKVETQIEINITKLGYD